MADALPFNSPAVLPDPAVPRWAAYAEGALIVLISLALLTQCWDADFINYDDAVHIHVIPQVYGRGSLIELFGVPTDTYMPLTYCSYRLDYVLFGKWMLAHWHNWAPAVRLMTWVYHATASLVLWRIMLLLGIGRLPALFVALVFAVHPAQCETVCWASERKNALAAMFGLASVWSYLALDGKWSRVPVTLLIYALALCGKPTALGFLPLFGFIELFNGAAGLRGERPMRWLPDKSWHGITARIAPFAALSMGVLWLNLHGKADTIVPPPGGSVYTGILTDAEVLLRYLGIMVAPISLSIAYYVEPIVSLLDPRLLGYGLILAGAVAFSLRFARNPRLAAFGWIWFVVVLTPCLNIVCISYAMQDRYIYFTMPGFFLALAETVIGLGARLPTLTPRVIRGLGTAFIALLTVLSIARSAVYQDAYFLAKDAVEKQPLSGFAHYLMINSYALFSEGFDASAKTDPKARELRDENLKLANEERVYFLSKCPDAERQVFYTTIAMNYGEHLFQEKKFTEAERFLRIAAFPKPHVCWNVRSRSQALRDLAFLKLAQDEPRSAYELSEQALTFNDAAERSRFLRARAALAMAEDELKLGHADIATDLKQRARTDLESVPEKAEVHAQAQTLLEQLSRAP